VFKRHPHPAVEGPVSMAEPTIRPAPIASVGSSILTTMVGATGMIVSAFLDWIRPDAIKGVALSNRAYWDVTFGSDERFLRSAGLVAIVVGLVAILGLAVASGWLTRLAGAAGIVGFATFTITMYRAEADLPAALGPGPWFLLGGGLLALFGGFFARRPKMIVNNSA
jgi:hypothetical protein